MDPLKLTETSITDLPIEIWIMEIFPLLNSLDKFNIMKVSPCFYFMFTPEERKQIIDDREIIKQSEVVEKVAFDLCKQLSIYSMDNDIECAKETFKSFRELTCTKEKYIELATQYLCDFAKRIEQYKINIVLLIDKETCSEVKDEYELDVITKMKSIIKGCYFKGEIPWRYTLIIPEKINMYFSEFIKLGLHLI